MAPDEGKKPRSMLTDKYCEELAHPYLFPAGKFGYKVQEIRLTPVKYFNRRLLNYTQNFSSDSDYIFFAHSVIQQFNLCSRINIAMQKVKTDQLTAGMLCKNFKDCVKSFVANDEAFTAYWICRVCRTEEELREMSEDSTDIFKSNMLDCRPDLKFASGKYEIINDFCHSEFLAHYILVPKKLTMKKMTVNQKYFKKMFLKKIIA